jgi:hypothetical protein
MHATDSPTSGVRHLLATTGFTARSQVDTAARTVYLHRAARWPRCGQQHLPARQTRPTRREAAGATDVSDHGGPLCMFSGKTQRYGTQATSMVRAGWYVDARSSTRRGLTATANNVVSRQRTKRVAELGAHTTRTESVCRPHAVMP